MYKKNNLKKVNNQLNNLKDKDLKNQNNNKINNLF